MVCFVFFILQKSEMLIIKVGVQVVFKCVIFKNQECVCEICAAKCLTKVIKKAKSAKVSDMQPLFKFVGVC